MSKLQKSIDNCGYNPKLRGTWYLADAARIMARDRKAAMCKEVYPTIAAACGTSAGAVERAIRGATQSAMRSLAWRAGWADLGGHAEDRPTNGEVVARFARVANED